MFLERKREREKERGRARELEREREIGQTDCVCWESEGNIYLVSPPFHKFWLWADKKERVDKKERALKSATCGDSET